MAVSFPQSEKELREREKERKKETERQREEPATWKSESFCNLILEVTDITFCCILFFRSESLGPADT